MKYIRSFAAPLALSLALVAGACSTKDKGSDTLAADTALNNDLRLANQDSAAQPALTDVPAGSKTPTATKKTTGGGTGTKTVAKTPTPTKTTTPAGNTVTKTPAGSAGVVASIPSGSNITLTSNERVCTNTKRVGDRFTATVAETVTGAGGASIPSGAQAVVQVTSLKRSENANDEIIMGFNVISVTFGGKTYNVDATTQSAAVEKVRNQPKSKDAQKVAIGAAIGAAAGQVLGKDTKSTVIGAAAGAAAGTAVAVGTANYEGCVAQGGRIVVKLNNSMSVIAD
jgi:hypothetical protein